jgi:hypothetical protein
MKRDRERESGGTAEERQQQALGQHLPE